MLTPQQLRHYLKDFEITVWADAGGFNFRVTLMNTDADGFRIKTILSEKEAFPTVEDAEETAKVFIRAFILHSVSEADKMQATMLTD